VTELMKNDSGKDLSVANWTERERESEIERLLPVDANGGLAQGCFHVRSAQESTADARHGETLLKNKSTHPSIGKHTHALLSHSLL